MTANTRQTLTIEMMIMTMMMMMMMMMMMVVVNDDCVNHDNAENIAKLPEGDKSI